MLHNLGLSLPAHSFVEVALSENQIVPESAVVDESPELASVSPEFSTGEFEDMPAFAPVGKMLPSQRMARNGKLIKLVQAMPESWRGGDVDTERIEDLDADAIVDLFAGIEEIVFDLAADSDAMREWILEQEDPESALMAAFGKASELLGN